ncbi:MAG: hypothetical protein C0514_02050 [Candidatus Puniceispirillum sp.]|nr:hypothetical protein [Candidatus Puniceispirillum sp.]
MVLACLALVPNGFATQEHLDDLSKPQTTLSLKESIADNLAYLQRTYPAAGGVFQKPQRSLWEKLGEKLTRNKAARHKQEELYARHLQFLAQKHALVDAVVKPECVVSLLGLFMKTPLDDLETFFYSKKTFKNALERKGVTIYIVGTYCIPMTLCVGDARCETQCTIIPSTADEGAPFFVEN